MKLPASWLALALSVCAGAQAAEPADEGFKGKTMTLLKKPVDAGKGLTQKLRDRFRRDKQPAKGND